MNIGEKLKLLRQKLNLSQDEFAEVLGMGKKAYWNYENNKRNIPSDTLAQIVHLYHLNLNWLLSNSPEMFLDEKTISGISKDIGNHEIYALPVRGKVEASMGAGAAVYDESITDKYFVTKQFVREINVSPQSAEIIYARGDSMEPTIQGGDCVLIDLSKTEIHDGCIYCIRLDEQLLVKRLQKLSHETVGIISDNPKYKIRQESLNSVATDFKVIGEVRWWGRIAK